MALTGFVEKWVDEAASLTGPGRVIWCDGSTAAYRQFGARLPAAIAEAHSRTARRLEA
jgi:GTP-dependent phosphoenolpyruvate carboxykinase